MKKVLLVAAVAGLSMVSCKKDYTCTCTTTDSTDPSVNSSFSYTGKMKKSDADTWCTNYKVTAGTLSTNCSLK